MWCSSWIAAAVATGASGIAVGGAPDSGGAPVREVGPALDQPGVFGQPR